MDYCDVFISCLDSFWRHPFTSEDPLVSKLCNAIFFQICSDEETTHLHGCKEAENFWKCSRICGVFSIFGKNLERVFFFTEIFCPFSTPTKSTFLMAWGWVNFKQILIFGWTIPLIIVIYIYIYNYLKLFPLQFTLVIMICDCILSSALDHSQHCGWDLVVPLIWWPLGGDFSMALWGRTIKPFHHIHSFPYYLLEKVSSPVRVWPKAFWIVHFQFVYCESTV